MSRLSGLLRQVEQTDPSLAADIAGEVKALASRRAFGLNFERHTLELVELPGRPVRKGDKVRFLAERGEKPSTVDRGLWRVAGFLNEGGTRHARLVRHDATVDGAEVETAQRAVEDLVVVAEFRDPIHPGLVSTGTVERGGDKPFHSVINAENFHALQTLLYTHEGKVDAIYIDPPYNTGAKDWKYNNDYVDGEDAYRHSKWLAMMERRLKLAKRLLNPENSVLIVTIDEKEYLRLGLLLEQVFPEAAQQMVSSLVNPKGVSRGGFRRADEYIFVVMFGHATPVRMSLGPEWSTSPTALGGDVGSGDSSTGPAIRTPDWTSMMRRGSEARRDDRPSMFYPIYVDPETRTVVEVGEPLGEGTHEAPALQGLTSILPIRRDGSEGRWQVGRDELILRIEQGRVRLGRATHYGFVVNYLPDGAYRDVMSERFEVTGRAADGSIIAVSAHAEDDVDERIAPTQWKLASHNASENGSTLLTRFLPRRKFPFPKSLYAVEDTLRFFVADKPDATILDFFAGSGTTAHAVMRLNKQDGGRRQCISVTNNEVSADEQKRLRKDGLRPGDAEWEALGICDYITKPRIAAAITGNTPDGEPIKGDYKFTDEFPMSDGFEENVEFFTLTYEAPRAVAHHRSFEAIAPLLWLKAGSRGIRIEKATDTFAIADTYTVLFDLDCSGEFLEALAGADGVDTVFVVTDDDRGYQMVCGELPPAVEAVRLYSSYLTNFAINIGQD